MREKAVKALSGFPDFIPVAAPAEATTLPDNSVSAVTMGSALHWFDPDAFGKECRRILTPGGLFFAVINARDYEDPFTKARHGLLPGVPPGKRGVSGGVAEKAERLRPGFLQKKNDFAKRAGSIQKMTGLYKLVCLTGF